MQSSQKYHSERFYIRFPFSKEPGGHWKSEWSAVRAPLKQSSPSSLCSLQSTGALVRTAPHTLACSLLLVSTQLLLQVCFLLLCCCSWAGFCWRCCGVVGLFHLVSWLVLVLLLFPGSAWEHGRGRDWGSAWVALVSWSDPVWSYWGRETQLCPLKLN